MHGGGINECFGLHIRRYRGNLREEWTILQLDRRDFETRLVDLRQMSSFY